MKRIWFSIFTLLLALSVTAQQDFISEPQPNVRKISLSFVPHYIIFHGVRFDYEYQNKTKAYVFAPMFYYMVRQQHPITTFNDIDLYKLYGAGMQIHRKFIRKTDYNNTGYIAAGVGYTFFYTRFREFLPTAMELYDNTVYVYSMKPVSGQIHRLEASVSVGIQNNLPVGLMTEAYIGVGYRYAMSFFSENIQNPLDRIFDPGYTGMIFIAGIKFGFSKYLNAPQVQTY